MLNRSLLVGIIVTLVCVPALVQADDTEIFGGGVINIPPNVLILFDNSGSMDEYVTVPATTAYDNLVQYTGSYNRRYVYRERWWGWESFVYIGTDEEVDSGEISCDSARNTLNAYGHWQGRISSYGDHPCGSYYSTKNLRTGNYLNYFTTQGPVSRKKIDIAKETVGELIDTTDGVRFGLFVFNDNEGGYLLAPLKSRETQADKDALKTIINGLSATTWTPLAETLAEIGLYYARQPSWFNSGVDYSSDFDPAVLWRCQKNYVIIMTDGESTQDRNSILTTSDYLYGNSIGDYDNDVDASDPTKKDSEYYWIDDSYVQHAYGSYGSDYLDDVAKFLYDEDLITGSVYDSGGLSFDSIDFPKQNVVTYTIGFAIDHPLLTDTSDSAHGQGDYFTTNDNISLSEIFESILGSILEANVEFVAPVVPVNRMNKTYADNGLYLGIFSPDNYNPGVWKGNIKKFGLSKAGEILDRDGNIATEANGSIKEGAHSAWIDVTGTEGMTVDIGGAGAVLKAQSSRTFKTFKEGTGYITFNDTNVTAADLGLSTDEEKTDLMSYVTATGIYAPGYSGSDGNPREWIMGDILHSRPAILYDYANSRNVIFVGANDGFLHCFVDSDQGTTNILTDDTVSEAWAFIPWDILTNLQYLPPEGATQHIPGDTVHDIYVDGSPVVYESGGNTYVAFGLRRGGADIATGTELAHQYFILDVTTYSSPSFVKSISTNILGSEMLGQSWSTPHFCRIKDSGGSSESDVLLIAGGYDTNQDTADPGAGDTKGRGIFAVGATDGILAVTNLNDFNYAYYDKMNYCMIDLRTYDDDDDGCDDVIYAPSLGGDLFVFESKKESDGTYDGIWSARLLFQAQMEDGSTAKLRKFHSAPGVAQELWGDYVYIGSGDRENPSDTSVTNRFYAIRNTWPETWDDTDPITDSDLSDETADVLQGTVSTPSALNEQEKSDYRLSLASGQGWFFDLEHSGEKAVSVPLVYNKVVYFTTFTPTSGLSSGEDLCSVGAGSGIARLYAVDYKTGEAVFPWFDGNENTLTKEDRYHSIGSGIPSDPVLVVTEQGAFVATGTEGGAIIIDTGDTENIHRYFWLKQ
ncbi:MAG: pilus assembly protein [Desulfomonilia bacterium]